MWDAHTTSMPRQPSLDVAALGREPVATLGVVATPALQGVSFSVSHALVAALAEASPPIRGIPTYQVVNQLNDKGLVADYTELLSTFARTGILERERLQGIGSALGVKFVLQPGIAEFSQSLIDRFEVAGWKLARVRVTTLRLWVQLWDAQTGQMLWASEGEAMVATDILLKEQSSVPLDQIAQNLWSRMIQNDLLDGETRSRFFFSR